MIKTDNFVRALLARGLVDDAVEIENGYDIQHKGNILSVRFDGKGGALLYNKNRGDVVEVKSGHLDDVLHRYIVQSLFGLQSKTGFRDVEYKDVFFVPTKVVRNSVIFEDSTGRKFTVSGSNPKAVLSFYNEAVDVNADDCMVLLSNFEQYFRPEEASKYEKDNEVELQMLKCSLDIDDYAVFPKAECINDVGQTVVGNFLVSSADKVSQMTFEEDVRKAFASSAVAKRRINSEVARIHNPLAQEARKILASSRKAVVDYLDSRYPSGLCVSALEQAMAYEAPSMIKASNVKGNVNYKKLFSDYLRNSETVSFRLDSNKSVLCSFNVPGKSIAKFRAIPDVGAIKSALQKEGYLLSEMSDGLEFASTSNAVALLVNSMKEFTPVSEKMLNKANIVSKLSGKEVTEVLSSYGIEDKKGVFVGIVRISVN